jgi:hypothetical protein
METLIACALPGPETSVGSRGAAAAAAASGTCASDYVGPDAPGNASGQADVRISARPGHDGLR